MNDIILSMKKMKRAMQPYVFMLYELIMEKEPKINVLEIGVRQGQSTRTILSALKEKGCGHLTSISIDLPNASERIPVDLHDFWTAVAGDSHKVEVFDSVSTESFDVLLIDGDHSYNGVKQDFAMYAPLVKKGGIILLHDVCNQKCGVPEFWAELLTKYHGATLNYGTAGMGIITNE